TSGSGAGPVAVIVGPAPVQFRESPNPNQSAPLTVADDVVELRATLAHWNGNQVVRFAVHVSFDGGATWVEQAVDGPSPAGTGKKRDALVQLVRPYPLLRRCGFVFPAGSRLRPGEVCGEAYYPEHPANVALTKHSDYAAEPSAV